MALHWVNRGSHLLPAHRTAILQSGSPPSRMRRRSGQADPAFTFAPLRLCVRFLAALLLGVRGKNRCQQIRTRVVPLQVRVAQAAVIIEVDSLEVIGVDYD
jgi:hypothetical protein